MSALAKHNYSIEEYFALELESEEKFEYWDGNVWTMSGASIFHNVIVRNLISSIDARFRGKSCYVLPSDTRIEVPTYPPYRYPDVSALCSELDIKTTNGLEILMNPQLIIEVLSPSTEAFDRGEKFAYYKSIPTFCEYILVSQNRAFVTQFIKQNEREWLTRDFQGLESVVRFEFVECELALSDIYRDVKFDAVKPILREIFER